MTISRQSESMLSDNIPAHRLCSGTRAVVRRCACERRVRLALARRLRQNYPHGSTRRLSCRRACFVGAAMSHVMNTYARLPVAFERGEGVWLWDTNGKRYLDA